MVTINSHEHLTFAIQSIYSIVKKFSFEPIRFSLPFWDPISKGINLVLLIVNDNIIFSKFYRGSP